MCNKLPQLKQQVSLTGSSSFDASLMSILLGLCLVSSLCIQVGFVPGQLCTSYDRIKPRESILDWAIGQRSLSSMGYH